MLFPDAYIKQTEGGHLYEFGCCWDKTANKSNLQKEEFIFGSVWRYSQFITQSEDPVLEMVLPMFRMNLAFSVKPFWGHAHRQRLRCISMAVLNPFNLTVSTNHFTTCSPSLLRPSSSHTWHLNYIWFWRLMQAEKWQSIAILAHCTISKEAMAYAGHTASVLCMQRRLLDGSFRCLFHGARDCSPAAVITDAAWGRSVDILLYQLSSTKHS